MTGNFRAVEEDPLQDEEKDSQRRAKTTKETPWHSGWLPCQKTGLNLDQELISKRNLALCGLYTQLISTIAGLCLFFARKNELYIVGNLISMIILCVGFYGCLTIRKWHIAIHSITTLGLIGVFWLFLLLEALFRADIEKSPESHMSERYILFLCSLPYLIDVMAGVFTLRLAYVLIKEPDVKSEKSEEEAEPILAISGYDLTSDLCSICLVEQKTMMIYKCGHQILCNTCAQKFKDENVEKCPVCMSKIEDIVKVIT